MKLPFTTEQFLENFSRYNTAVYPPQVIFYLVAIIAFYFSFRSTPGTSKIISMSLAFFWLWMGIAYHLVFFTSINKAAYLFGAVFIVQSFLIYQASSKGKLTFRFQRNLAGITGCLLILFALVVYPALGFSNGHVYPSAPTFGLPCPTTIFTFGIFLFSDKKFPLYLLIIPFLWSIVGFTAALNLGITEDTGLLVAGVVSTGLLIFTNRKA